MIINKLMKRNVCIECEKIFLETVIKNHDLELLLDKDISYFDNRICIKCLTRIVNRYIK